MTCEFPISAIGLAHLDAMHRASARRRLLNRKARRMFRYILAAFGWTPSQHARDLAKARAIGDDIVATFQAQRRLLDAPDLANDQAGLVSFREMVERTFPTQQYQSPPASRWRDLGEAGGLAPGNAEGAWQSYLNSLQQWAKASQQMYPPAPEQQAQIFPDMGERPADAVVWEADRLHALKALTDPHLATGEAPAGFLRGWRDTLVARDAAGEWRDEAGSPHHVMIWKLDWLLMRLAEAEDALRKA